MLDLWKMRQKTHQKQMFKYLRYVLNDHFILALLFILGGLAFELFKLSQSPLAPSRDLVC